MKHDNRKDIRKRLTHIASMHSCDGEVLGACTIKDISERGARLAVATAAAVPSTFVLWLSLNGSVNRQCEIAWRSADEIGVKFPFRALPPK